MKQSKILHWCKFLKIFFASFRKFSDLEGLPPRRPTLSNRNSGGAAGLCRLGISNVVVIDWTAAPDPLQRRLGFYIGVSPQTKILASPLYSFIILLYCIKHPYNLSTASQQSTFFTVPFNPLRYQHFCSSASCRFLTWSKKEWNFCSPPSKILSQFDDFANAKELRLSWWGSEIISFRFILHLKISFIFAFNSQFSLNKENLTFNNWTIRRWYAQLTTTIKWNLPGKDRKLYQ